MKARLVKYSDAFWTWEIYGGNGSTVCAAWRVFPSKRAASRSLDNFLWQDIEEKEIEGEFNFPVLDCSEND